nr:enoyl-CoA hydratase-related protein [Amycolatopsis sp. YIM 10]
MTTRTIGRVLLITIDRPHVHNAVDRTVLAGMRAALDCLESAPGLQAGVLTGAGGTSCSGADLRTPLAGDRSWTTTSSPDSPGAAAPSPSSPRWRATRSAAGWSWLWRATS